MIAIIDYGMGNLRSVQKAFEHVGANAKITHEKNVIESADAIVLPGVGAMGTAMEKLSSLDLIPTIKNGASQKPFLGICVGLQLLFEKTDENDGANGLGILKGSVNKFTSLKIPQIGWNQIHIKKPNCPLYKGIDDKSNVYFCHSYFIRPEEDTITATETDYGKLYSSSIWKNNIFGVQFHPEKSQEVGLKILKNFSETIK